MNTQNVTQIYYSLNYWFEKYRSSWLSDSLNLFLLAPVSLAGVVLNLTAFIILSSKEFNNKVLNTYLRIYVFNSLIVNINGVLNFWPKTYRYFSFSNSEAAAFFFCFIFCPVLNTTVFTGSVLGTIISLERASQFFKKYKLKPISSPKIVCLIVFLISFVFNFQYFFLYRPAFIDVTLDTKEVYRINYWKYHEFSLSLGGSILNYIAYATRDVVLLIIENTASILTVILLKRYFSNVKSKSYLTRIKTSSSVLNVSTVESSNNQEKTYNFNLISKADQKATIMVLIMCILATFEHIMFIAMVTYLKYRQDVTGSLMSIAANFSVILKHFSNFILLYFFNKSFKEIFTKKWNLFKNCILGRK